MIKRISFFLVFLWPLVINAQLNSSIMKFISYNVLHGFNGDSTLENKFIRWANIQDADIFAFQELNGFTHDKLEELAKKYGHLYAVINTGVTHPIGITSRYPIVMVQHVTTNMWHSYLYGNINGIHVFVTHLSPFEVKSRRADIDRVLAHARLLPSNEKIIIAGDFNSLSAADSAQYDSSLLKSMLLSEGRLEPKSGLPIVKGKIIYRNNLDDGKIDYTVMNKMVQSGFIDAYHLNHKNFKHSAPSKSFETKNSKLRRIDFIWINPIVAKTVVASDIIHDDYTDNLSDHYPVMVEFQHSY